MKKKFLKISGVVVILIAVIGVWGYNKYFTFDSEIQKQLNEQFGDDFFNVSVAEKGASDLETGNNSKIGIEETEQQKQEDNLKSGSSTSQNSNGTNKTITQDEIIQKYMPEIKSLQSVALSRLDTLYSAAINEYKQSKKNGNLNPSELAQKYIQAGTLLEGNVDGEFYNIVNAMQAELVANNFSTDIINTIKNDYESAKSQKRSQLLSRR
ncbi:MAG: hypothetical protein WCR27_10040 [Eubacteriales bacterium]